MRMRSTLLISLIAFALAGMVALATVSMVRNAPFGSLTDASVLEEVGQYKNWTTVNPRRQRMDIVVMTLCTAPGPSRGRIRLAPQEPGGISDTSATRMNAQRRLAELEGVHPHDTAYISVFVNPVGREAMMKQAHPKFPVGSVIVKEKFPAHDSEYPELLTVMMKREPGYDSTRGDWEYLVMEGDLSTIRARGKLRSCQGCHIEKSADDYVFRTYLPHDVARELD
jgi:hypothetical protein